MDLLVQRGVDAKPSRIARLMFDPQYDTRWITGAKPVEPLAPGPVARGLKAKRDGGFLAPKGPAVTQVTRLEPDRLLEMRYVEGPMKGTVGYEIERSGGGALVSVHIAGATDSPIPGAAWLKKRAIMKDLDRLAALLEPKR